MLMVRILRDLKAVHNRLNVCVLGENKHRESQRTALAEVELKTELSVEINQHRSPKAKQDDKRVS